MSMKIGKKILAGALAVMSAFMRVSAEPIRSKEMTTVSANVKKEDSKYRKAFIVGALGVAAIATVGGLTNEILKIRKNVHLNVSRQIFLYYLVPEVKKFIDGFKETEQIESAKHLLDVLEKGGTMSRRDFMRELDRASGLPEDKVKPCVYETLLWKNTSLFLGADIRFSEEWVRSTDTVIIDVKSCINDLKYLEDVMKIETATRTLGTCKTYKAVYDLTSVIMCDEENYCFTTAYVKHEDGKWHRHSFDGFKETIDDDALRGKLSTTKQKVSLVYTRKSYVVETRRYIIKPGQNDEEIFEEQVLK